MNPAATFRPCVQCGRRSFTSAHMCTHCRWAGIEAADVDMSEAPPAGERRDRPASAFDNWRSANTRTAYRTAWQAWEAWADSHGVDTLPAKPEVIAAYLTHRAEGNRMPTVRMAAVAIAAAHMDEGHPNPCAAPIVRSVLRGLARMAAAAGTSETRQADALTDRALTAIRATACASRRGPTGRTESATSARTRGLVDTALCQVMADAGLRRSEAAALVWDDIKAAPDGSGRVTVRRSKTDRAGWGAVVVISAAALQDLDRIRQGRPGHAPVFGLSASQIHRRVKAAARAAGLGDGFGGHSGRVGLARRMVSRGAPVPVVQRQGRWASSRMVDRYTRREAAAAALPYL